MKTKYEQKEEVEELRKNGLSLIAIEKQTGISRGTLRYWCRHIVLNEEQKTKLKENQTQKGLCGRLIALQVNKDKLEQRQKFYFEKGAQLINTITNRELLLIGTALYWAEGMKAKRAISFSNTDPNMIGLFIKWLTECMSISRNELRAHLHIHAAIDEKKEKEYWKNITKLSDSQFYKSYISKNFKPKGNINKILHGVLTIRVQKSTNLFYQIMGMINQLNVI